MPLVRDMVVRLRHLCPAGRRMRALQQILRHPGNGIWVLSNELLTHERTAGASLNQKRDRRRRLLGAENTWLRVFGAGLSSAVSQVSP